MVDEIRECYLLKLCTAITEEITLETYNFDRYVGLSNDVLWNKILDIANDTSATLMDLKYAWNVIEDYIIPLMLSSGVRHSTMDTTCQVIYDIFFDVGFDVFVCSPGDISETWDVLSNVLQTNGHGDENNVFAQVPVLCKQYLDILWYATANTEYPIPTAKIVRNEIIYSQTTYL